MGSENVVAFSEDSKSKIIIKSQEFCPHERDYLELVVDFIEKL